MVPKLHHTVHCEVRPHRAKQDNPLSQLAVLNLRVQLVLRAALGNHLFRLNLPGTLRSLSVGLLSSLSSPILYIYTRVVPFQMQNPELDLKLHETGDFSALQFVETALKGLFTLKGVNSSSQFSVIWKQYTFMSWVQVIDGNIHENYP